MKDMYLVIENQWKQGQINKGSSQIIAIFEEK